MEPSIVLPASVIAAVVIAREVTQILKKIAEHFEKNAGDLAMQSFWKRIAHGRGPQIISVLTSVSALLASIATFSDGGINASEISDILSLIGVSIPAAIIPSALHWAGRKSKFAWYSKE